MLNQVHQQAFVSFTFAKNNNRMEDTTLILLGVILLLVVGIFVYVIPQFKKNEQKNDQKEKVGFDDSTRGLRLQAYERLTLLVDRIALPNLISRVNQSGLNAREMQMLLTKSVKEEYDYNISQQIYVTPDAWNAVKNLKEQNMLVVNQLASALPPHATGLDLNKLVLEYMMTDKRGLLHEVVSEVLSYEAKRIL